MHRRRPSRRDFVLALFGRVEGLVDSNCQKYRSGNPLPHFTPWPTPGSAGVNVFANSLPARQNIYIFLPFVLIGPLLRYIFSQDFHDAFTLVVPDFHTRPFWWAPIQAMIVDRLLLGRKGSSSVLLFPSRHSPQWLPRNLQWDLWAFGKPPVAVLHVCIQMKLTPIFVRRVVRRLALSRWGSLINI